MSYPISTIAHVGLGGSVYASLREALITGRFLPDSPLRIRELAAQLGTSVTPVRDAILQLAKEQALEMRTPKDIRVPRLSAAQYAEIRQLRLELEGLGAQTAAERISEEELRRLAENLRLHRQAAESGCSEEALRLNGEFHLLVAGSARLPLLVKMIDMLWMRAGPLMARVCAWSAKPLDLGRHEALYQALRAGDAMAARDAMQGDIDDGNRMMTAFFATIAPDPVTPPPASR
ncbi:GntR family transcriptional regulator [Martelella alba]|uniref:GntR family transcriptional regulator n=1 Tax=Martelella alba TaxID=2590451 RepID=A0ABY2SGX2_9HYPH|nr:GntR family transcriptional regulator [Martelella alba]TKI03503.1 GntR family transcriptional regulator [Martelella alba]